MQFPPLSCHEPQQAFLCSLSVATIGRRLTSTAHVSLRFGTGPAPIASAFLSGTEEGIDLTTAA
jgi:hypothetical protein